MNNNRKNPVVPFIISIFVFVAAAIVTFAVFSLMPSDVWSDEKLLGVALLFGLLLFIFHRWAKWLIN